MGCLIASKQSQSNLGGMERRGMEQNKAWVEVWPEASSAEGAMGQVSLVSWLLLQLQPSDDLWSGVGATMRGRHTQG